MADLKVKNLDLDIGNGLTYLQNIEVNKSILKYIGLKALVFEEGAHYSESLEGIEACVVVVEGKVNVKVNGKESYYDIGQRKNNFDKNPTDAVYVTNGDSFEITTNSNGRVVIGYAKTDKKMKSVLIKAEEIETEHRGKGMNIRDVNNILADDSLISDQLIVVEVYTGEANWSSYPPHKHDTASEEETLLEEIYYHEQDKEQGFVFQRIYTDDLDLDETMTVNNYDTVLVPKGYHPVAVPYGYNSYYLNVMAGPRKEWKFHNQEEHEWIIERKDV